MDRLTRIALLVHSMNDGGAQKRMVSLANGFASRGHMVDFVAVSGFGEVGRLLSPEVNAVPLEMSGIRRKSRMMAGLAGLKAYLKSARPTVLMAGSNGVHIVAAMAVAALDQPPLLILRAARHPLRNRPWSKPMKRLRESWLRPIERWAYRKADLIIAVSNESGAAIRTLIDDPSKVVVVPNPTITKRFLASLDLPSGHQWLDEAADGGDPVILGVGRLTQQKDFETLIKAVAIVNRTRPARLILLGHGGRLKRLEALAGGLGLSDRIAMMGYVDGVGGWMARASLLASSSLWEGSPGAIIEAFAAGCPVVATDCPGGSIELLENGVGGALVPTRDPVAMAGAIIAMLDRPHDRAAIRALALPYQDDGRADLHYLEAIEAAARKRDQIRGQV